MLDNSIHVLFFKYSFTKHFVFLKVIQRHNATMAKPPSPVSSRMHFTQSSFLPGHEAFSSLVDVASKQPFLPVPTLKEEKLPTVPLISIDQPSPMNDEIRYQIAREQIALQTAMQRHHLHQVLNS